MVIFDLYNILGLLIPGPGVLMIKVLDPRSRSLDSKPIWVHHCVIVLGQALLLLLENLSTPRSTNKGNLTTLLLVLQ